MPLANLDTNTGYGNTLGCRPTLPFFRMTDAAMPRTAQIANSLLLLALVQAALHAQPVGQPSNLPPPGFLAGVQGQTAWSEGFEGPNPSWAEAGGDARRQLMQHRRVQGGAHGGRVCEWFQLQAEGGSAVYVSHEAGHPRVIDELHPTVWVKSDRPGVQLIAEIAMPHTIDPQTGRPVVTVIHGTSYNAVGQWQQLEVSDIPRQLVRQLHLVRSQTRLNVESRDAYMNRAVLNIYGGLGVTNVWIDDLDIGGFVASAPEVLIGQAAGPALRPVGIERTPAPQPASSQRNVQLAGSVLLASGRPLLPRAIQHQGEPLSLLKQLGFNAVWVTRTPSADLLSEAQRLGLWVICPPPRPVGQVSNLPSNVGQIANLPSNTPSASPLSIGPEFQPVLAWDLGEAMTGEQLEATRELAQAVRSADARQQRPLICAPISNLRGYSRYVDLLLIDRRPLGTSLEMPDYGEWVRRQPLLARPGTPVWTTVQTQPNEALRRQLVALEPGRPLPSTASPEQMRLLVYTAISCGSRGLVFQSQSPLNADDADTRQRALALQLLNLELELIEPWVAAGSFSTIAQTSQAQVSGAVLRSDRARLVLPAWSAPGSQCVAPAGTASGLGILIPGVPESSSVYEVTAGRLQPLRHKRVTGGMRVTLDEFNLTGLVFLAQDPLVIDAVTRRAVLNAKRSAELERHLAAERLQAVTRTVQQIEAARAAAGMPKTALSGVQVEQQLAAARQGLQWCDAQLAAGDFRAAAAYAGRAMPPLRMVERAYWESALDGASPVVSAATSGFATLPWHWGLMGRLKGMAAGTNRLLGGDFEDLDTMLRSGWRHCQHGTPGIQTAADLVAEARHAGTRGLRLTARPNNPQNPPAILETPPVWITSPAIPVEAGQVVRIHGWVNIPTAITSSVDGLLVVDSLTGEDLAERLDSTKDWREFTVYRVVPQAGPMTVTFLLSGLGEARLDDVTVQVIEPSGRSLMRPVGRGPGPSRN
jgi:hypothetical protein